MMMVVGGGHKPRKPATICRCSIWEPGVVSPSGLLPSGSCIRRGPTYEGNASGARHTWLDGACSRLHDHQFRHVPTLHCNSTSSSLNVPLFNKSGRHLRSAPLETCSNDGTGVCRLLPLSWYLPKCTVECRGHADCEQERDLFG